MNKAGGIQLSFAANLCLREWILFLSQQGDHFEHLICKKRQIIVIKVKGTLMNIITQPSKGLTLEK